MILINYVSVDDHDNDNDYENDNHDCDVFTKAEIRKAIVNMSLPFYVLDFLIQPVTAMAF